MHKAGFKGKRLLSDSGPHPARCAQPAAHAVDTGLAPVTPSPHSGVPTLKDSGLRVISSREARSERQWARSDGRPA